MIAVCGDADKDPVLNVKSGIFVRYQSERKQLEFICKHYQILSTCNLIVFKFD